MDDRRQGDRLWNNIRTDLGLDFMIHDFIRIMEKFIIGYSYCH